MSKWRVEFSDNGWNDWICPACGHKENLDVHVTLSYNYCPHCGEDMRDTPVKKYRSINSAYRYYNKKCAKLIPDYTLNMRAAAHRTWDHVRVLALNLCGYSRVEEIKQDDINRVIETCNRITDSMVSFLTKENNEENEND